MEISGIVEQVPQGSAHLLRHKLARSERRLVTQTLDSARVTFRTQLESYLP
jgi:hypothetical protein